MGKLKDTMLMKTNAHFVNNPGWGIAFLIDGHKFHAKEGSDLCDLVRSIIMESIDSIKKAIDIRGYEENVVYTRTNEPHVKRERGTAIFNQDNLFEAIQKEVKTPKSVKITKRLVGETKFNEMQEQKEETKSSTPNARVVRVNIASELAKLEMPKQKVEVIREIAKAPSVVEELLGRKSKAEEKPVKKPAVNIMKKLKESSEKVTSSIKVSPEQAVVLKQYHDILKELKVEKLTRDEVRKHQIKTESSLFNKSHAQFMKIYEEWKNTIVEEDDSIESVFKQYENKLLELHIDKLKRDDARKYHIRYGKYTKDNYGMFLEMYQNWKMKK